jgi:CspA family cold shock protein
VWTTFRLRKGQRFYCDTCRRVFQEQQGLPEETTPEDVMAYGSDLGSETSQGPPLEPLTGSVKTIKRDKGYGFIAGDDGNDYFFHISELGEGLAWETIEENTPVRFEMKAAPSGARAGAATRVTLVERNQSPEPDVSESKEEETTGH